MNELASAIENNVAAALAEDIGSGDWTALLTPAGQTARAAVISRGVAVLCGQPWFEACLRKLDPAIAITWFTREGDSMSAGSRVCEDRKSTRLNSSH